MTVYLVGAGPGDPGLITVRGAELLRRADVVVHDRLLDPALLELAPPRAERIDVGKTPGGPVRQDEINDLLVERGRSGRTVVRLKGGDPFVLGRGGEEAVALAEAGVAFEVVPGVTSAVAVPAYAGIPVTQRGLAAGFTVVTGHSRTGAEVDPDWASLARAGGTVVVLMGVAHRGEIAQKLLEGGLAPTTPAAAISRGTYSQQRTVRTTLAELAAAQVEPTAVIVIGAVAGLDLAWFERRPLLGRRVVVTRAVEQSPELATKLREAGAEPVVVPVLRVTEPADAGSALRAALVEASGFDWIAFTSTNAVESTFACLRDARALGPVRVAAVGAATAEELRAHGVAVDLVPDAFSAEALAEALVAASPPGRVLLPQSASARPTLAERLRHAGWTVNVVEAYRIEPCVPSGDVLASAAKADAITFLSPSSVDAYLAAAGADAVPPAVVCIGDVTAGAARDRGLRVDAVADASSVSGVVEAVVGVLGSKP